MSVPASSRWSQTSAGYVPNDIVQSIFCPVPRRQDAELERGARRRGGGQKMDWTKPRAGCRAYGD
jgi:hypothetical protein